MTKFMSRLSTIIIVVRYSFVSWISQLYMYIQISIRLTGWYIYSLLTFRNDSQSVYTSMIKLVYSL